MAQGSRRGRRWRTWRWMPPAWRSRARRGQKPRGAWPMWRCSTIRCRRTGPAGPSPAVGPEPTWQARYLASLEPMAAVGRCCGSRAWRWGWSGAERWIALSDGGSGLEGLLRTHFPRVEAVILDFYHAAEYLSELAKSVARGGPGGGGGVRRSNGVISSNMKGARRCWRRYGGWTSGGARPPPVRLQATVRYFENQVHRMDYPRIAPRGGRLAAGRWSRRASGSSGNGSRGRGCGGAKTEPRRCVVSGRCF